MWLINCFVPFNLAEIDVIPVGSNLVKIWGVEAGLFLMIDDAGQMRATVSEFFISKKNFSLYTIVSSKI